MKILFFCTKFPPSVGGVQTSNHMTVKALQELGYDLEVLVPEYSSDDDSFDNNQSFKVTRVNIFQDFISNNLFIKFFAFIFLYINLVKKLISVKFDKIIAPDEYSKRVLGFFPLITRAEVILLTSVPEVSTVKNSVFLTKLRDFVSKRYYNKTKKIIFISESTKKEVYKHYGEKIFKNKKIKVIYRTIDDNFLKNKPNKQKILEIKNKFHIKDYDKVLLSVTRLEKKKGIDYALRALEKYKNNFSNDFKYIIVGDGKNKKTLEIQTKKMSLQNNVIFVGEVPYDSVINYFDLCDIFILPTRRGSKESFGRVFAEAAARGKAVIGGKTGGVKEVIDNGKTGFLVNPKCVEEIYKKLELLMNNKKLCFTLGRNGKKRAKKLFSQESLKKQIKELIK